MYTTRTLRRLLVAVLVGSSQSLIVLSGADTVTAERMRDIATVLTANQQQIRTLQGKGRILHKQPGPGGTLGEFDYRVEFVLDVTEDCLFSISESHCSTTEKPPAPNMYFEKQRSEWFIHTPEHWLSLNVNDRSTQLVDYPPVDGLEGGQTGRVAYRKPRNEAYGGFMCGPMFDPRAMMGRAGSTLATMVLSRSKHAESQYYGNEILCEWTTETTAGRDVLVYTDKKMTGKNGTEASREVLVFDSSHAFNILRYDCYSRGKLHESREFEYMDIGNGVQFPKKMWYRFYQLGSGKLVFDRFVELEEVVLNQPIPDSTFTLEKLGLKYGDRLLDEIADRLFVYDNGKLVPAEEFVYQKPVVAAAASTGRTWWPWVVLSLALLGGVGWQARRLRRASKPRPA